MLGIETVLQSHREPVVSVNNDAGVGIRVDRTDLSSSPYRHVVVDDFLDVESFGLIKDQVRSILNAGDRAVTGEKDYGAKIVGLDADCVGSISRLINVSNISKIASVLDVPFTRYIDAAIHVHPPGSPSGWLHTDFNAGWFVERTGQDLCFSERWHCDYRTGRVGSEGHNGLELTRSIAMILYFSDDWEHAHGGETVLCRSGIDRIEEAQIRVSPLANRLLAFECSPISFHSFAATTTARTSIIFWAHAHAAQIGGRWPLSLRSGWR